MEFFISEEMAMQQGGYLLATLQTCISLIKMINQKQMLESASEVLSKIIKERDREIELLNEKAEKQAAQFGVAIPNSGNNSSNLSAAPSQSSVGNSTIVTPSSVKSVFDDEPIISVKTAPLTLAKLEQLLENVNEDEALLSSSPGGVMSPLRNSPPKALLSPNQTPSSLNNPNLTQPDRSNNNNNNNNNIIENNVTSEDRFNDLISKNVADLLI